MADDCDRGAGIVENARGMKGIRDAETGEVLWYVGNCKACGIALYRYEPTRRGWCGNEVCAPSRRGSKAF